LLLMLLSTCGVHGGGGAEVSRVDGDGIIHGNRFFFGGGGGCGCHFGRGLLGGVSKLINLKQ
jgi:hypothetical protein